MLRLVDFDGDGDPDIIAGGRNHKQLTLYENLGIAQPKPLAAPDNSTRPGQDAAMTTASTAITKPSEAGGLLEAMSWRKAIFGLGLALLVILTLRLLAD